jgi:hypothetical protein
MAKIVEVKIRNSGALDGAAKCQLERIGSEAGEYASFRFAAGRRT